MNRSIFATLLVGGSLGVGLLCGGCTWEYMLDTEPISRWQDHQKLPLTVNLVITDQLRRYVFTKSSGLGDTFKYPVGQVVAINAQAMSQAAFASTVVTDENSSPSSTVDLTLTPEIGLVDRSLSAFAFDAVPMTADVKWTVADSHGRVVWIKTVRGAATHKLGNKYTHLDDAREHVNLVMVDLFNKSLQAITTAPELRALSPRVRTRPSQNDPVAQSPTWDARHWPY